MPCHSFTHASDEHRKIFLRVFKSSEKVLLSLGSAYFFLNSISCIAVVGYVLAAPRVIVLLSKHGTQMDPNKPETEVLDTSPVAVFLTELLAIGICLFKQAPEEFVKTPQWV